VIQTTSFEKSGLKRFKRCSSENIKFETFRLIFFKKYPDRSVSKQKVSRSNHFKRFSSRSSKIETFRTDSMEKCLDRNVSNGFLQKATTSKHFEWILFEKYQGPKRFVQTMLVCGFVCDTWFESMSTVGRR
jgi:hypothetical protein